MESVGLILLILEVVGLLETNESLPLLLGYVLSSRMVSVKIFGGKALPFGSRCGSNDWNGVGVWGFQCESAEVPGIGVWRN